MKIITTEMNLLQSKTYEKLDENGQVFRELDK